MKPGEDPKLAMRRMSRRSFIWGAFAVAFGYKAIKYLNTRGNEDEIQWPFRRTLEFNEELAKDYFSNYSLAKTYPVSQAETPKVNGWEGITDGFDPAQWKLKVVGAAKDNLLLTLAELQALPHVDMVTELRCVEGWAKVVHWTGCRLRDFVAKYPPPGHSIDVNDLDTLPAYLSLETPDGGYYVGLDMASALHPQTLLCWGMNGAPLTLEHGAPLRLVIPVKYGIKNIKRIGALTYAAERPRDFWAEEGYDWYAGL